MKNYDVDLGEFLGKKVVAVKGYASLEFDQAVFKVTDIVFDDGSTLYVEGEHDFPYVCLEDAQDKLEVLAREDYEP